MGTTVGVTTGAFGLFVVSADGRGAAGASRASAIQRPIMMPSAKKRAAMMSAPRSRTAGRRSSRRNSSKAEWRTVVVAVAAWAGRSSGGIVLCLSGDMGKVW